MGHGHYIAAEPLSGQKVYTLGRGEKLELDFQLLPGEGRDIDIFVDLAGEGAEFSLKGLYLCGGTEKFSIRTLVHHRAPLCRSSQLVKGIAGGNAEVSFYGAVVVAPGADGTDAAQENHNIVLTPTALVQTKPQLEIYADDVKCSHGATVGQLDAAALFYMRSRGIPEDEALELLMLSFLSPVIPEKRREDIARLCSLLKRP